MGPATAVVLLLLTNSIRDGRILFLLVTIVLNTSICDVMSSAVFPRNCPQWLILYSILCLSEYTMIYLYCRKPLLKMLESDYIRWSQISVIPISLLCTLTSFQSRSMQLLGRRTPFLPSLFLCATVILIYISLYHFQMQLLAQADILQYNNLLRAAIHSLRSRQNAVRATDEKIRIFRHDARHILLLIEDRLEQGDYPSASELLLHIREMTDSADFVPSSAAYTKNTMINAILNQTAALAQEYQVEFQVRLALPDKLRVDDMELAVVLSNALENAVDAAAKDACVESRRVVIQSEQRHQNLFLVISNNYTGSLNLDAKTGLPAYDGQSGEHGYGTLSIYNFARKYNCTLDCRQRNGRFYLRLLI